MDARPRARGFTAARIVALAVIGLLALGLVYIGRPDGAPVAVPDGAKAGDLALEPCTYDTEEGSLDADCGTLVVPENRRDPGSDLIALPVTRIRATGTDPAEPIFRLNGGPGVTNMSFPTASRMTDRHDVVLVGYRGVDSSTVLDCPEVESALRRSADFAGEESFRRYGSALTDCARRLADEGVDLDGYSLPQRVDDLEAARQALGYNKINLISTSAGTRTAMIYAWRHPGSLHRSVMIAANPPGHFLWDPATVDDQLRYYAGLCGKDGGCAARTADLAGSMAATSADMPDRWWFLPIKEGNVRAGTLQGMFHATDAAAPLNAPTTIDAWLAAAGGDPSGFWALSVLADLVFPESFVWGEFAASGAIDTEAVRAYYASGGDAGSILGDEVNFLWAGGQLGEAWPASPDYADYRQMRPSQVETLVVGGTVDFSTPARFATDELLPALPNGRQVILAELGHTADFWAHQPEAGERLLNGFFDRGEVDDSGYDTREVDFEVGTLSMPTIAKILFGTLAGFALIAIALLAGMARRVHRRGGFGPRTGAVLRALAPVIVGIGGWFLAILVVSSVWPALFGSLAVAVVSMGVAVALCVYLAWVHRDWTPRTRYRGLAAALAGSLLGAWLGSHAAEGLAGTLTALVGATLTANLALLTLDILRDTLDTLDTRDALDTLRDRRRAPAPRGTLP
jgi:pimeloyl-ACP methyl ester carboxylesterase